MQAIKDDAPLWGCFWRSSGYSTRKNTVNLVGKLPGRPLYGQALATTLTVLPFVRSALRALVPRALRSRLSAIPTASSAKAATAMRSVPLSWLFLT